MASGSFGEVTIIPEELEQNQDTPIRDSIFATQQEEDDAVAALGGWITSEIERSMGARWQQERMWEDNLRQYEGVSRFARRNTPIENASNLEVTLGAIASDAVYAQILNLIFNVDPLITVRQASDGPDMVETVKVLQRFIDVISKSKLNLRQAAENSVLDHVKLGTGVYYTRWAEKRKKTQVEVITDRGPIVKAVPLEDFFVPGGAFDDIQRERWVALRHFMTKHELNLNARDFNWDIEGAQPMGTINHIRQVRERLGHTSGEGQRRGSDAASELFETFDVYCLFDIDGDGIDEDLLVTYDWGGKKVMKWRFNPYTKRPFEAQRYQLREHMFYGIGIIEMTRPFQEGATNLYNNWMDNSLLANTRFWVGKYGAVPNNQLKIWPNRFLAVQNPETDIRAVAMADTYASAPAGLQTTISFAEKRTGVNDLTGGKGGASPLGSRTPGITTLSLLQKSNERFGPAFAAAKNAMAGSVVQGLERYQERLLADDQEVMQDLRDMLGEEDGNTLIEALLDVKLFQAVRIELTASDAGVNKEADRQNWLLLVQQLVTMGEKIMQLTQVIESPEVGDVTKNVAQQLVNIANEILDRTMRTFDTVRDPRDLLIDLDAAIQEAEANQPPPELEAIQQLLQQMGGAEGAEQPGPGAEVGAVPFG